MNHVPLYLEYWFTRKGKLNQRLYDAVERGEVEQVRELLRQGADPNAFYGYDCALSRAGRAPGSNAATVSLLLEWGADVRGAPSRHCVNPLIRAAHQSDDARIRVLVEHGAELNIVQKYTPGFTPLQELSRWAELDTLTLLLDRGADPNMPSLFRRWRALHIAAVEGRSEVLAFLLERGAQLAARDAEGKTALDFAREVLAQPCFARDPDNPRARKIRDGIEVLAQWA